MTPRILIVGEIVHANQEIDGLDKEFGVEKFTAKSREEWFKDCESKYQDIEAIFRTFSSANQIGIFDRELIEKLPKSLKYICHNGAGYETIDVKACSEKDILVSNTPGAVDAATADTNMFLILSALRGFWKAEKNIREGKFKQGLPLGGAPEGKVLGIVGMGGIGRAVAKRAIPFGMKIQYFNRHRLSEDIEKSVSATYVSSLEELLKTSDVVSLNLPLNANTQGTIGQKELEMIKVGSVLVNTARGAVIDEDALIKHLQLPWENEQHEKGIFPNDLNESARKDAPPPKTQGGPYRRLRGIGLDVFVGEPDVDERLLKLDDGVCILPHMGTETRLSQWQMETLVVDNLRSALTGKGLVTPVAEQQK